MVPHQVDAQAEHDVDTSDADTNNADTSAPDTREQEITIVDEDKFFEAARRIAERDEDLLRLLAQ